LSEAKNRRIFLGASKYQNFRKMKGNNKIPCIGSNSSLRTLGLNCNLGEN